MITQIVLLTSFELPRGMCPVAGRDAERRQEGSHRFPERGPFLDVGKMAAVLEEHELGAADVGGELLGAHGRVPRAEAQGPNTHEGAAHCATGRVRSPSTRTGTAYRLPSGGRESGRAAFGADRAQKPLPKSVRGTVASTCCW